MFYALVNTLEYASWCMQKESNGEIYTFNVFMKEYLATKGTKSIRCNVPEIERAGLENSWILLKRGWSVLYTFSA